MALDPEKKKAWVEALRSGKYLQGKYALRTKDNHFCCLGVAVEAMDLGGWADPALDPVEAQIFDPTKYVGEFVTGQTNQNRMPPQTRDLIGLDVLDHDVLIGMNDNGKTFGEIADYIERKL